MFLRNHWYVAAWSDELGSDPLAVTMLNEDIVLYRKQDGAPVALENRCAHRRLPLSEGNVVGDTLECGYHGLTYDCSGACIKVPGQSRWPKNLAVKSYPVVERHRFIYVWMGDLEDADDSLIIDFPRFSDPDWGVTKIHLDIKANYLLIIDNLLELSHVAYLHATTIGNAPVAEDAVVKYRREGDFVRVTREMVDVPAARTYAEFGAEAGNFDRWQTSEWRPPAYFLINNGSESTGRRPPGDHRLWDRGEWGFQVYHGITPATEKTTHQFWAICHPNAMVPEKGREEFYRQCHQVIWEDVGVYEAQQIALDTDPEGPSAENVNARVRLDVDGAFIEARRVIRRMLEEEEVAAEAKRSGRELPRRAPAEWLSVRGEQGTLLQEASD